MLRNYYNDDMYPCVYASEFTIENEKKARSVFSKCHMALFYYLFIASIAYAALALIPPIFVTFGSSSFFQKIIYHPAYEPALNIICMYIIAFPIYCFKLRGMDKAPRDKSTVSFMEFFSLAAISVAVMQLGAVFAQFARTYISTSFSLPYEVELSHKLLKAFDIVPSMLFVIIIGPIFEELIFRKLMIDRISIYGDRLAIIVSSVAFGLHHGNLTQFIYTTMAGIVFGHIYTKTRRIIYPILLHMIVNFFGTFPNTLYYVEYDVSTDVEIDLSAVFNGEITVTYVLFIAKIVIFLLGVLMFFLSLFLRKYRWSKHRDIEIPVTKLANIVLFNPGTVWFFIYCAVNIFIVFITTGI